MRNLILMVLLTLATLPVGATEETVVGKGTHSLFNRAITTENAYLEGRFKQQKTLQDLGVTIESSGTFFFSSEGSLRWQVREPVASELRITREEIVEIQDGEEVMRMATDEQPMTRAISEIFFAIFTGDRGALETYFGLSENGSPEQWSLSLDPVDNTVASVITSIELQGGDDVEEIILRETNGDRTRILLIDAKLTQP